MIMFRGNFNPNRGDPPLDSPPELPAVDKRFEQLSAYLDGELSTQEARQVEDWLATDAQGRQLYSQLAALQAGLANLEVPTMDSTETEMLISRVFDKLDQAPVVHLGWGSRQRRRHNPWGQVAAALLVLAGAGWAGWRWYHPQPLVSLEEPPVRVAIVPASARVAQRYLFEPGYKQDAYSILFEVASTGGAEVP